MPGCLKKICIFGATGNTGLATVESAIKFGYEITAFVRDSSKLPEGLKVHSVIQGNVLNKEDVSKAVQGQDAIIIVLGTRNDLSPTTILSEGTKNILEAMKTHEVMRVSCCVSSFLFWDREKVPKCYIPITEDHQRMVDSLKASDREWIAVFPPHISSDPARGDYVLKNDSAVGRVISKYDLGEILVKCLTSDEHLKHTVGMGYPEAK